MIFILIQASTFKKRKYTPSDKEYDYPGEHIYDVKIPPVG